MYDFSIIQDNSLIICPSSIKEQIISYFNKNLPFYAYKIISKHELIAELTFTSEIDAVVYLNQQYDYSYDIAAEILNNLPLIKPGTEKLDMLYNLYLDLLKHQLLKTNPYFKEYIKTKNIYICGYSKKDQELSAILTKEDLDFTYIENQSTTKDITVYEFETEVEEVRYIISQIISLYNQGISLNNIYIYNLPNEYHLILKKHLYYHHLHFEDFNYLNLYDSQIYQTFINYRKTLPLIESYHQLLATITYDPFSIIDVITSLIVTVSSLNLAGEAEILALNYLAKQQKVKGYIYDEMIKSCNANTVLTDKDYVFMLGFSQNTYPIIYKDTDIYTDIEKIMMNKNSSTINNEIAKEELINFIYNTPNLTITYKKIMDKTIYYPSIIINELNLKVEKAKTNHYRYSKALAEIEVASYYDNQRRYGINHPYLSTYSQAELQYNSYNHHFIPFKIKALDQKLELSYTQIEEYNTCPYKYYLKRLLKVNSLDETFDLNLGNLFHQILQDSINKAINLTDYEDYINEHFKTPSFKFFLKQLLKQLLAVIKKNNDFKEATFYQDIYTEEEATFNIDENTTFTGKMDKVMIDQVDKSLIIVDYKTGNLKYEEKKFAYGINLQLPSYILLAKKRYNEFNCTGIFIQKIIDKHLKATLDENYLLDGICVDDLSKIKRLDSKLGILSDKSSYIKGIAITKNGTLNKKGKTPKSEERFEELAKIALEQITSTKDNIRNGLFDISPVYFGPRDYACRLCKFKDICFKTPSDYRIIDLGAKEEEDES